jgi:methylaspartate mutase sigma subunit
VTGRQPNRSVVIGTISADAHMIGGWVLQKAFQQGGFRVTFRGAVVPQQEFINAAIETDADAILVSSMYGMALLDGEGLRDKCIEAGLEDIILYVAGTLAAPLELEKNWPEVERRFPNTCSAQEAVNYLTRAPGLS